MVYSRALVGIVHEINIALENFRIELQRVLDHVAIIRVLFIAQHVNERAVVHAMHAQRSHEISFEQPEGFRKEEGARSFGRAPIHHLAPELVWYGRVEFRLGESMLSTRRNRAAGSRNGIPKPLVMLLG